MTADLGRLRRFAPLAVLLVIAVAGWGLVVAPLTSAGRRAQAEADGLEERLAQVRAAVGDPPPSDSSIDPVAAFASRTAIGDASSRVVLQLATLAQRARADNLTIETGLRVVAAAPGGPQPSNAALSPDPRFALFGAQLAYTPITMAFDAEFAALGGVLWAMRDLPTTIEIRSVGITRRAVTGADAGDDRRVHVSMVIFAYGRESRDEA